MTMKTGMKMNKNPTQPIKQVVSAKQSLAKKPLKTNPKFTTDPELQYQKIIGISDLNFAAFIKAKYRLKIAGMKKDSTGRLTWSFELLDKDEAFLIKQFYGGASVSAMDYASEIKNLKASVYNV